MTYDPIDTNEEDSTADGNITGLGDIDAENVNADTIDVNTVDATSVDVDTATTTDLNISGSFLGANVSNASSGESLTSNGDGTLGFNTIVTGDNVPGSTSEFTITNEFSDNLPRGDRRTLLNLNPDDVVWHLEVTGNEDGDEKLEIIFNDGTSIGPDDFGSGTRFGPLKNIDKVVHEGGCRLANCTGDLGVRAFIGFV